MPPHALIPILLTMVALPAFTTGTPADPFLDALKPFGQWSDHPRHGRVWRPDSSQKQADWRPYGTNGRWLATAQGWYWHSEQPWGWATCHYGRWGHDTTSGWYWVPDTVWAPSWVTFRMNADHLGWAPLPPGTSVVAARGLFFNGRPVGTGFHFGLKPEHYTFVPLPRTFDASAEELSLPLSRVREFFGRTTVINAVAVDMRLRVNNQGVPLGYMRGRVPSPLPEATIAMISEMRRGEYGSLSVNNGHSVALRPEFSRITPTKRITAKPNFAGHARMVPRKKRLSFERQESPETPIRVPAPSPRPRKRIGYFLPSRGSIARPSSPSSTRSGFTPAMPRSIPRPITSTPQLLGAPRPIVSTPQILGPPRPVTFPPATPTLRTNLPSRHPLPVSHR